VLEHIEQSLEQMIALSNDPQWVGAPDPVHEALATSPEGTAFQRFAEDLDRLRRCLEHAQQRAGETEALLAASADELAAWLAAAARRNS
jgi:hypothetical protein